MSPTPDRPLLTPAEAEVMEALWRLGRGTVREVAAALPRQLAYTTVLTMLRILERKGYVGHAGPAEGRAYVYAPRVERRTARRKHQSDLVRRLFAGEPAALVAGLIEDERLDEDELTALRRLIDAKLRDKKKG